MIGRDPGHLALGTLGVGEGTLGVGIGLLVGRKQEVDDGVSHG